MTVRGTRILASGMLEQVEAGASIEIIVHECKGSAPCGAIVEVIPLAGLTFLRRAAEFSPPAVRRRAI